LLIGCDIIAAQGEAESIRSGRTHCQRQLARRSGQSAGIRSGSIAFVSSTRHVNAENHARHAGGPVIVTVLTVRPVSGMRTMSGVGEPASWRHVIHHVAVEEPVTLAHWCPGHRHRAGRLEQLRHDLMLLPLVEPPIAAAIALAVDGEVEAVEMHRVRLGAQIDDAPVDRLVDGIGQTLGRRPGTAIEEELGVGLEVEEGRSRIVSPADRRQAAPR